MNKKISQFPGIITLQDGYLIPAVKDGVNYVFNTASLKSYLNKTDVGLSAVDNTSDINKPISAATQTAISGLSAILFNKTDIGHLHSASDISDLTNMFSGYSRTNHTHVVADITDLVLPNMNLYATVQDMLARTTEARVLQLITQNTTGAVDLGPTNIRIDNVVIRIAATEAGIAENQITTNTHNSQISSLISRLDTVEASGLDVADLQNINNQFTVLTNSLTAKANISHTHTTAEITDFAVTVGNLIASVINVNAINADLNGIHTDLLAIHTSLDGKADTTHLHSIANITGLQAALDAKSGITHVHDFNGVTGLQTALDGKANVGHIHTEYAPITHNHVVSEVNGLQTALAAKAPLVHNHALIDITGLQNALDAKASVSHTHTASNITDFSSVVTDIIDQQIIASNSSTGDTYYNNVVLLLHGTGANNSTVFTDSSPTPKTITVYGNAKISTTQSKFSGSSLYFDGSGDYLSIATSQDFDLGNVYTIEFFVYNLNATPAGGILHKGYYSSITHLWSGFAFSIRGIGTATRFYFYASTNVDERYIDVPASLPQNAWQHVAMVRNGSSGAVYIDGVPSGTITGLNSTVPSSETLRVGLWDFNTASEYFNGHLAEVRVTKGVARYTAAFAPPAIEFPNINSGGGTPGMLSTALTDLAAQIAAINSGSGSGASSGFTRMDVITSSGSWTIPPGVSAIKATVIGGGGAGAYGSVSSNLDYSSGGGGGGGGASVKYLTDLTPGATLLATVGNGGVSTNGSIGQGSVSKLTSLTQSISTINADGGDGAGRVINCDGGLGSLAAYIAASGDPYYSNVSLLLHMDGANNSTVFTDSSPTPKTIIANGDAVINTSKAKLGTGALSVTTSGSLTSSTAGITDFTTNNFTIECSFKAAVIQSSVLIATGDGATAVGTGVYLYTVGNGIYFFCYSGSTGFSVGAANCFNVDTYTHVAVIRAGVKLMLFVDGFLVSSITTLGTSSINTITPISIGRAGSVQFNGYIDEVRITKGIARYSGNFLTPVVAYPDSGSVYDGNYGNVALLLHMDGGNNSTVFTDNSPNPKTVTVYGNAKISTTQSKFSGSSLYCDGNGDYIEIAAGTSTDFNIGLSDFVVETFYFPTSSSIDQTLIAVGEPVISTGANLGYAITHFGSSLSGKVRASFYSGTTQYFVDSSAALSLNVWNHIAFVRISGVIYLYVNGVQQSSLSANFNINTSNTFIAKIGKYDNNTTRYLSGYLDELRITKGVGRYATGFTPVVSAFPNLAAPDTFPMTGSSVISIPGNSGDNGMFGSIDLNTAGMQNAKLLKGGSGGDAAIISAGGGVYNPISASYSNGQAYGAGGAGGGIVYNSTTLQYSGSKGGNGANGVIIIEY